MGITVGVKKAHQQLMANQNFLSYFKLCKRASQGLIIRSKTLREILVCAFKNWLNHQWVSDFLQIISKQPKKFNRLIINNWTWMIQELMHKYSKKVSKNSLVTWKEISEMSLITFAQTRQKLLSKQTKSKLKLMRKMAHTISLSRIWQNWSNKLRKLTRQSIFSMTFSLTWRTLNKLFQRKVR